MTSVDISTNGRDEVAVLLHPSAVPVIDVFRSMRSLDDQFDLSLLDFPEAMLTKFVGVSLAKSIVSDALLIAFALTRQREKPFHFSPIGSRYGTVDEYYLLVMIGSSRQSEPHLRQEAAALLDIDSLDFLTALAGEIVRQIELGTIVFRLPDLTEFRAMRGLNAGQAEVASERSLDPAFNFKR